MRKPEYIVLKRCFDKNGKYKGKVVVLKETLTPEFLAMIKADKEDKHGWKQHKKVMKEKGYDI